MVYIYIIIVYYVIIYTNRLPLYIIILPIYIYYYHDIFFSAEINVFFAIVNDEWVLFFPISFSYTQIPSSLCNGGAHRVITSVLGSSKKRKEKRRSRRNYLTKVYYELCTYRYTRYMWLHRWPVKSCGDSSQTHTEVAFWLYGPLYVGTSTLVCLSTVFRLPRLAVLISRLVPFYTYYTYYYYYYYLRSYQCWESSR